MAEAPAPKPAPKPTPSGGGAFGEFLTKKVGPLEVWMWGLVIAGVGIAAFFWSRNQASNSQATSSQTPNATLGIDPSTGLPYADTTGLYPTGASAGAGFEDYANLLNQIQAEITALQNPPAATT